MTPPTLEQRFAALFLQHEPPSKARMTRPGANDKYYQVKDETDAPVPI